MRRRGKGSRPRARAADSSRGALMKVEIEHRHHIVSIFPTLFMK
jgi:hypothetical protein